MRGTWAQRAAAAAKMLVSGLGQFRLVLTVASLGYCAVHWIASHGPTFSMFLGALIFGVIAAIGAGWLSHWLSSSSSARQRARVSGLR